MTPRAARRRRAGYALLLVIGFNVLLLAVWSVAYRSVGAAFRVEMTRSLRRTRDDGTMTAMGLGVALLQTGTPTNPDKSALLPGETYVCYVQLETPTGLRWFAVAYTSALAGLWTVRAYAVDSAGIPTMPNSFATS